MLPAEHGMEWNRGGSWKKTVEEKQAGGSGCPSLLLPTCLQHLQNLLSAPACNPGGHEQAPQAEPCQGPPTDQSINKSMVSQTSNPFNS